MDASEIALVARHLSWLAVTSLMNRAMLLIRYRIGKYRLLIRAASC